MAAVVQDFQNSKAAEKQRAAAEKDPEMKKRLDFLYFRVKEELYDYSVDPDALKNLIDSPEHKEKIAEFRQWMLRILQENKDPYLEDFKADMERLSAAP